MGRDGPAPARSESPPLDSAELSKTLFEEKRKYSEAAIKPQTELGGKPWILPSYYIVFNHLFSYVVTLFSSSNKPDERKEETF